MFISVATSAELSLPDREISGHEIRQFYMNSFRVKMNFLEMNFQLSFDAHDCYHFNWEKNKITKARELLSLSD